VIRTLRDGYQTSRMRDATSRSVHTRTISRMEHACVNTSQMQCVHKGWVRGVFLYAYHENVHCDGTFLIPNFVPHTYLHYFVRMLLKNEYLKCTVSFYRLIFCLWRNQVAFLSSRFRRFCTWILFWVSFAFLLSLEVCISCIAVITHTQNCLRPSY